MTTLIRSVLLWWWVAAQHWISPLFLPPPGQVLAKLITIAGPQGFMDGGARMPRTVGLSPIAMPTGIPISTAAASAVRMRPRLAARCCHRVASGSASGKHPKSC